MNRDGSNDEQMGAFQLVVLTLSLVVLGALVADTACNLPAQVSNVLQILDTSICFVLLADFAIRLYKAESRLVFLKWGWIDLVASIPNVPLLRAGRLIRVLRIIQLLRALRATHKITTILLRDKLRGGVASVFLTAFLLVMFSSVGVLVLEGQQQNANIRTAEDAIWWSVSTITTVGYGDKYPVTTEGRMLAMLLMISGVGMFGMLSGAVASYFAGLKQDKINEQPEVIERMEKLEERIEALHRKGNPH